MVDPPHGVPPAVIYRIERGAAAQAGQLRDVERAAGTRFRAIGMSEIADHDPTDAEYLAECAEAGRLYVAQAPTGIVAGFLIWAPLDSAAYIEEVAVDTAHAGHRLAARLIDRLAADVRGRYRAITLATFRDVPWNAPYYAKLGFKESADPPGPEHAAAWQEQAGAGLDMARRMFMVREIA